MLLFLLLINVVNIVLAITKQKYLHYFRMHHEIKSLQSSLHFSIFVIVCSVIIRCSININSSTLFTSTNFIIMFMKIMLHKFFFYLFVCSFDGNFFFFKIFFWYNHVSCSFLYVRILVLN